MTVHQTLPTPPSAGAENQNPNGQVQRAEKRNRWLWAYSFLLIFVLAAAVISLVFPSRVEIAATLLHIKLINAVFALLALLALSHFYAIQQEVLIKRLRRQLAEKQDHSGILRSLAMFDPLTGLHNRHVAEERLAAEVSRSERRGHPLTVLILDLNNFKQINDTYGHSAGDRVLQEFAGLLARVIRKSDLAVRLGGDEFLVLLPECNLAQLQLVLVRLGSLEVDWRSHKIPVTFSAGFKQYEMGEQPDELLARADKALYANKRAGKKTPLAPPVSA